MSEAPFVSVVVPVLNGATTIANTLQSLLRQEGVASYEVIVVDNGSTDETPAIVRRFPVTLLFEPKRGAAAARNCGLRGAAGAIVAFCDADTVLTRRWLAELVAAFDEPSTVIAAGQIVCYPPKTGAERYLATSGVYDVARFRRAPFPLAPSGNMAVRRDAALAVGGFDEAMLTAEDADFSYRVLLRYPGEIAYRDKAMLFHQSRAEDEALRRQARAYGEGVARLYRRYPTELPWDARRFALIVQQSVTRSAYAIVAPVLRRLHLISPARAEFARYHRLWTCSFWWGFLRWYYTNRRFGATS